jgi:transitional endoplasmic reticulum ATPase
MSRLPATLKHSTKKPLIDPEQFLGTFPAFGEFYLVRLLKFCVPDAYVFAAGMNFLGEEERARVVSALLSRLSESAAGETRETLSGEPGIRFGTCILDGIKTGQIQISTEELTGLMLSLLAHGRKSKGHHRYYPKSFLELKTLFSLNEAELRILSFLTVAEQYDRLSMYLNCITHSAFLRVTAAVCGLSVSRTREALSEGGQLSEIGLVVRSIDGPPPHYTVFSRMRDFFFDSRTEGFGWGVVRKLNRKSSSTDLYGIAKEKREIVRNMLLLQKGVSVLLTGSPALGTPEIAFRLASSTDRPVYVFNGQFSRLFTTGRTFLLLGLAMVKQADGIILLPGNEGGMYDYNTLQDPEGPIGVLLPLLEQMKVPSVWVSGPIPADCNEIVQKITYRIETVPLSPPEREIVLNHTELLKDLQGLISQKQIAKFAEELAVSHHVIDTSLDLLSSLHDERGIKGNELAEVFQDLLSNRAGSIKISSGGDSDELFEPDRYDPEALNTDITADAIIKAGRNSESVGMNLLFWGPPGTGKTAFTEYLCHSWGKPCIHKLASELFASLLGETENNIAQAFLEARKRNAVLFLDEADSYLINRRMARYSWELSQTNELLSAMERYRIITICSTNFLESLDPAVLRRFDIKVAFRPLTADGLTRLYKMYFPVAFRLIKAEDHERLARLTTITPGDFRSVSRRLSLCGLSRTEDNTRIIDELCLEVRYRCPPGERKAGFSLF